MGEITTDEMLQKTDEIPSLLNLLKKEKILLVRASTIDEENQLVRILEDSSNVGTLQRDRLSTTTDSWGNLATGLTLV